MKRYTIIYERGVEFVRAKNETQAKAIFETLTGIKAIKVKQ